MVEERKSSGSNIWIIVGLGLTALVSVTNGFWSIANPKGDIKDLKEDFAKQIAELKGDFVKSQTDARWTFASKDLVNGKVDSIDKENLTYRRGIEILISRIETKGNALDSEIHGTYSPKDALASINARLLELERGLRDTTRQPVPVVQK